MHVRAEEPRDASAVSTLNRAAFGTSTEAELVDRLRAEVRPIVSLVAETRLGVVGHILFTPVELVGHPRRKIMGLAPMAVAPEHQRQGIGSALVRAGLERCATLGYGAVVVLGHAAYYPRFGFAPAVGYGIRSEYDVPEEAFMVVELRAGYLDGAAGTVRYHAAFHAA